MNEGKPVGTNDRLTKSWDLYTLRETVQQQGVLISFAGPFSHGIIEELGQALTRYLESQLADRASLMDVFSIFIEQAQNVRNYGLEREEAGDCCGLDFNSGIVTICRREHGHAVCSGNYLRRVDADGLTSRIDHLATLDRAGLKALYKEQLRSHRQPGKGGGLGLIDMSRRTSRPLEYELRDLDSEFCFFSLCATVSS